MIKIRLARGGAKKRPYYSIVVADSHSPRDGRFIEKVGTFNPLLKKDDPQRVTLKVERLKDWMGRGAQPTDRVARFMAVEGLTTWQHGDNPKKGVPHKKTQERAAEQAAAAAAPKPAPQEVAAEAPEPVVEPAAESAEAAVVEAEAAPEPAEVEEAAVEAEAEAEAPSASSEEEAPAAEAVEEEAAEAAEEPSVETPEE